LAAGELHFSLALHHAFCTLLAAYWCVASDRAWNQKWRGRSVSRGIKKGVN